MNDNRYAIQNALFYTSLIAIILLAPLVIYLLYMKNIYSIQNEIFLKEKSLLIIKSMEEYDQNEVYFEYPRFNTLKSGLYDARFKPIFTLIDSNIPAFKNGYYTEGTQAYLTIQLPKSRYFGAEYLILSNKISYSTLYMNVAVILLSITVLVFLLSMLFLNRFAEPFKALNKQLDSFIKDSIHEINTPLSIINVNIDLYNRKNEPNKYFQRIKAATKVLSNIYDDMDYLIKYNRLDYLDEEINLSQFVRERIEYFTDVARMKDITINMHLQAQLFIVMNPKKLRKIVDNNISNAIKYSFENNIIEVYLFTQKDGCYLSVRDYGIGIKDVDKIFKRYYREDKNKGGFGIGLNIVKSIIDEYDIELDIDSKLKNGSTFTYKFPTKLCIKK
ncbi:HAMP domain-containing sensor histidine kinase [Sulfurimonas sp. C5]|uniref:sensor histidine kinase n=1 Tax=Sulfurimonas sp. C5 TaxID=3036947 RepID=UPI0024550D8A|nr:HAMP domain-containing sensor histidine kinase [Sulfurimonas sp. C5]MDH4944471.1 HAMP domain-containing sensor histidine kinase [Sulfurimonas sp. C5]